MTNHVTHVTNHELSVTNDISRNYDWPRCGLGLADALSNDVDGNE